MPQFTHLLPLASISPELSSQNRYCPRAPRYRIYAKPNLELKHDVIRLVREFGVVKGAFSLSCRVLGQPDVNFQDLINQQSDKSRNIQSKVKAHGATLDYP